MSNHNYFVYISTDPNKTVLYTGMTNDLYTRMEQHYYDAKHERKTFAGKYYFYNLIFFEHHTDVNHAIEREKEIKSWNRAKKIKLIFEGTPSWKFLNEEVQRIL